MKKRIFGLLLAALLLCGCTQKPADPAACTHVDKDDNGFCDSCEISVKTTVDFYAINDLHGKFQDGDNQPGLDELTTYLKMAAMNDDHQILLSSGDTWQGSSESNLTQGMILTDWMNEMGFASMTLGNHEFDWGEEAIAENAEFAEFPLLAINVYDRETNQRVDYCDASVVIDCDGIQIGIIGAIGDCYSSIAPEKTEGVYFKVGSELTALVKAESERLRAQGVDFIVYSLHDGFGSSGATPETSPSVTPLRSYYDVSLSNGYVDLVFEGHTHQQYRIKDEFGVYHLQNKGDNRGGISHVEISINKITGTFRVTQEELVSADTYSLLPGDSIVSELLEKYKDQISDANEILGKNSYGRDSWSLMNLAAMLYYEAGMEAWGDEYEIVLGGGFFSIRSPYTLRSGDVRYADLLALFPFDNDLVLCSISGRDLQRRFIDTNDDRYATSGDAELMRGIDPNRTYYVVVDTYTSSYGPNRLTVVEEYEKGVYARDLLADYIKKGGLE